MKQTGQTFEMNPDTFTLENVFAMELHRFHDTIGEIVNMATKELAIEKVCCLLLYTIYILRADVVSACVVQGVKEVEETWGQLKFNILKYIKGTSDRGWIVGAVDEVLQILDDNAMQLQGETSTQTVARSRSSVGSQHSCVSQV